jgi:hypothetical protein
MSFHITIQETDAQNVPLDKSANTDNFHGFPCLGGHLCSRTNYNDGGFTISITNTKVNACTLGDNDGLWARTRFRTGNFVPDISRL